MVVRNPVSWGDGLRQRMRLYPLYMAMRVGDVLARWRTRERHALPPWHPGVSVVIPERGAPAMLEEALEHLFAALARVAEPHQVIVVVNGSPADDYAHLSRRWPAIEWRMRDAPLSFAHAIADGLARARHDWTLLLNNDMALAPGALATLAAARADDVFAVAAQILQASADGRREETGFTDWYADGNGLHLLHAPVRGTDVVPHLCASGGASLFRTARLRSYLPATFAYDPFYWEDAEWSVRAWRDGWRVLFAPAAEARHRHRATTSRFYAAPELERIVLRNRLLFEARTGTAPDAAARTMQRICDLPYASQRELARLRTAAGVLAARGRRRGAAPPAPTVLWSDATSIQHVATGSYSFALRRDSAPAIVVVVPFAIYPPRHGGARRVAELVRELARGYRVVLVSDEATLYDARSLAAFDGLAGVYLVQRPERPVPRATPVDARMSEHVHPLLIDAVRAAIAAYDPVIVQVEHAELAGLVAIRSAGPRWVLTLHDACSVDEFSSPDAFAAYTALLARYDGVIVCSPDDAALVQHPNLRCVANGSAVRAGEWQPSTGCRLMFVGPFRYAPNARAIRRFLAQCYPAIKTAVPAVELTVLGGDEALMSTRDDALFAQPGVRVMGHRDDVPELLRQCTLTVNPQEDIRGSAVKVVESLCAGRICVSTRQGARGFEHAGLPGLVVADDWQAMSRAVIDLLRDAERRHVLEQPDAARLAPFQWSASAALQTDLYRALGTPGCITGAPSAELVS